MMDRTLKSIHMRDAVKLLKDGSPHRLRLWELRTGGILEYAEAVYVGSHERMRVHRVRLLPSGQIRSFREITLHRIDGLQVYL